MSKENFTIETMYKSVRRFWDLGTGRDYKKVLVGDSDDARIANFSFAGNVHQNWPSWRQVTIKTGDGLKIFDTATQTLNGKPAHIFFWNELTADLWFRQIEREKLLKWIEVAESQDLIGMAELIVEQTESDYRVCAHPGLARLNLPRIQIEIRKLSRPALRNLNSLIDASTSADPAASPQAA